MPLDKALDYIGETHVGDRASENYREAVALIRALIAREVRRARGRTVGWVCREDPSDYIEHRDGALTTRRREAHRGERLARVVLVPKRKAPPGSGSGKERG